MAEYIEREALKRSIRHAQLNPVDKGLVCLLADEIPAADVEPVKRGEWIGSSFDMACSACGIYQSFHVGRTNYCPNCGAKMKG